MARTKDLLIGVGLSTRGLNRDLGRMRKGFQRSFGEIKRAGRQMTMAITGPLVALGAAATKTFVGFEHSMAKVKAVSGATSEEFKRLENNAKRLGRTTVFTASEVAGLQLEFSKLGFTAGEIEGVTEGTLQLAQATGSDLKQAAEVAGATLRGFGLDVSQTGRVTDVMAKSFSTSALDMKSFQDSMKYVAPVAKAAGVSIEETTAMLAQMANAGIKGSQAGTSLRMIFQKMASGGGDVSERLAELADKGLNLDAAFDEVGRRAQTALLVLGENKGKVDELTTSYKDAAGSAAEMAGIMDATTFGAFARMKSAIEGVFISIGQILAPVLERLSVIVGNAMAMFQRLSPETQRMAVMVAAIAAAIGPLLVMLPTVVSAFGMVAGVISGPVLVAIGAVIAAVVLIRRNWDSIVEYFTNGPGVVVWMTIQNAISAFVNAVVDMWNSFVGLLQYIWMRWGDNIGNFAARAWNFIVSVFTRTFSFLSNLAQTFAALFSGDWETMWQRLKNVCVDFVALILRGVSYMVEEMLRLVDWGLQYLGAESDMAGAFASTIDDAVAYLDTLKTTFEDTGEAAQHMFDTMSFGFGSLFSSGGGSGDTATPETRPESDAPEMLAARGGFEAPTLQTATVEPPDNADKWSSWSNGMRDMLGNLTTFFDELSNAAVGMGQNLGQAFMAAASGAEDSKQQLKNALGGILDATFAAATAHIIQANAAASTATGPLAPIVAPLLIGAGMAMIRGMFSQIVGFKDGGIVSGPTLGLVGEYSGARTNPEVIAPLNKLENMIGGGTTNVVGTIRGRDIVLSNERGGYSRRRALG